MLKRIRPSIGSAHVIALLALFAALGGGYATAFSGSGTLQKGAMSDIPGSLTTVRSLTGIGNIQAKCDSSTHDVTVQFNNTTGTSLHANAIVGSSNVPATDSDFINPLFSTFYLVDGGTTETKVISLHLSPVNISGAGVKSPQANVQISAHAASECSASDVEVLALNTQE